MKRSEFNQLSKEEKSKMKFRDMPAGNKFAVRFFLGSLAIFLIIVGFVLFTPSDKKSIGVSNMPTQAEAYFRARRFVKENLKSPSSADFPLMDYKSKIYPDSTYEYSSYVDAKNAFNVEIRSKWYIKMKYNGGKSWKLLQIVIN